MDVLFFCPHWGSENIKFNKFTSKIKSAGYDGVEVNLLSEEGDACEKRQMIKDAGLEFIAIHWDTMHANFDEHKEHMIKRLNELGGLEPLFINSHTGKDFFSFEQNVELLNIAEGISKETGVKIIHETHRSRFSFAAHITKGFIERLEWLKLSLDLSHWCNVAESFLQDQTEAVEAAISRCEHVHTRVGFEEGPQVPDPRAPEWKDALDRHIGWWDRIIENAKSKEMERFTITTEFGPAPYMPIIPYTKEPISSQWEINVYIKDTLKERYG